MDKQHSDLIMGTLTLPEFCFVRKVIRQSNEITLQNARVCTYIEPTKAGAWDRIRYWVMKTQKQMVSQSSYGERHEPSQKGGSICQCVATYLQEYRIPWGQLKPRRHDSKGRPPNKASACSSLKEKQKIIQWSAKHHKIQGSN